MYRLFVKDVNKYGKYWPMFSVRSRSEAGGERTLELSRGMTLSCVISQSSTLSLSVRSPCTDEDNNHCGVTWWTFYKAATGLNFHACYSSWVDIARAKPSNCNITSKLITSSQTEDQLLHFSVQAPFSFWSNIHTWMCFINSGFDWWI